MKPFDRLSGAPAFRIGIISAAMVVLALVSTSARRIEPAALATENDGTAIHPFQFHASDEALADLRRRIT